MSDLLEQIHELLSNYQHTLQQLNDVESAYDVKMVLKEFEEYIENVSSPDN